MPGMLALASRKPDAWPAATGSGEIPRLGAVKLAAIPASPRRYHPLNSATGGGGSGMGGGGVELNPTAKASWAGLEGPRGPRRGADEPGQASALHPDDLADVHVIKSEKWRHVDDGPDGSDLIEGIVQLLRRLIAHAEQHRIENEVLD